MTYQHFDKNSMERRVERIETMLFMLCMHLGLDPRTKKRLAELRDPSVNHSGHEWGGE